MKNNKTGETNWVEDPEIIMPEFDHVFVVLADWDEVETPCWTIKAVFKTQDAADRAVEGYPKTAEETGWLPMRYKIERRIVV